MRTTVVIMASAPPFGVHALYEIVGPRMQRNASSFEIEEEIDADTSESREISALQCGVCVNHEAEALRVGPVHDESAISVGMGRMGYFDTGLG